VRNLALRDRLKKLLPTPEQIHAHPHLSRLGPRLTEPRLWHWSRRGVALGVALGVFFGLLIPVAQIPASVGAAILLRANIPAAAASTLVTNPVTFGPVYYAAYRLGSWITGDVAPPPVADAAVDQIEAALDVGLWQRITALGKSLLIGLAITAVLMGLLSYALITAIWRWRVAMKWRRRTQSNGSGPHTRRFSGRRRD
jgi:uncharacterized protein (DUF2062 family)